MELTSVLIGIFITIIVGPLVKRWIEFRKFVTTIDKIPGPEKKFFYGNALELKGIKRDEIFEKFIVKRHNDFPGGISRFWTFHKAEVRLSRPEYVEQILSSSKNITKPSGYELEFKKWLGDGLILSTGEHWFSHRKVITPTFHFLILEGFCDVMAEKINYLMQKLEPHTGQTFDVVPPTNMAALDIICETAMGIKIDAQDNGDNEYCKAAKKIAELDLKRRMNPLLRRNFFFSFSSYAKQSEEVLKIIHGFTDKVIAERKLLRRQNSTQIVGHKRRLAFLDLLLEETEKKPFFTEKDVREEVDTFMFAGHDTTTVSTVMALFLLGHHPEIQEKILDEQKEIMTDLNGLTTYKNLLDMTYLDCVIKECLRIYPPISNIARRVTEEFEVGGYTIPVGTTVGVSIWGCNRDERYFPDPNRFDPDRWLPENSTNYHAFSLISFSAGPRNCIGKKFAQLEMKSMLSAFVRNYKWKSVDSRNEMKLVPELVARPLGGVKLILEKRK